MLYLYIVYYTYYITLYVLCVLYHIIYIMSYHIISCGRLVSHITMHHTYYMILYILFDIFYHIMQFNLILKFLMMNLSIFFSFSLIFHSSDFNVFISLIKDQIMMATKRTKKREWTHNFFLLIYQNTQKKLSKNYKTFLPMHKIW